MALFDKIIRTQEEFEALIASPTWLDAVSVCFIGNGGSFKFIKRDGSGIKIPVTVKQIQGMNSATIEVSDFFTADNSKGALWYEYLPVGSDYYIKDLIVNISSVRNGNSGATGFHNCYQLTNCSSTIEKGSSSGRAFLGCNRLVGCHGKVFESNNNSIGFASCTNLINCEGLGAGISGSGFLLCTGVLNCTGSGETRGGAFNNCTQLVNCTESSKKGVAFYQCRQVTNGRSLMSDNYPQVYAPFISCSELNNCISLKGSIYSFLNCQRLNNCTGTTHSLDIDPRAFQGCEQLSNCSGTSVGSASGYSFYNCRYMNGCSQEVSASKTAFLGGTNTKIDTATVVAV